MKTFKLSISTPRGKNFETEDAVILNANVLEGRIGVMANRSPLVSSLKFSDFSIKLADGTELVGVAGGGVLNVTKDNVTILTTRFSFADEVDVEQTKASMKLIESELQKDVKDAAQASLNKRHIYHELKLKIAKK